jgi:hypothetical protein
MTAMRFNRPKPDHIAAENITTVCALERTEDG